MQIDLALIVVIQVVSCVVLAFLILALPRHMRAEVKAQQAEIRVMQADIRTLEARKATLITALAALGKVKAARINSAKAKRTPVKHGIN